MIEIRVYRSNGHIRNTTCSGPDGKSEANSGEIFDTIRAYPDEDVQCLDVCRGQKDITGEKLTLLLKVMEEQSTTPRIDLNRVIRNGGFVEYIKKLERK